MQLASNVVHETLNNITRMIHEPPDDVPIVETGCALTGCTLLA